MVAAAARKRTRPQDAKLDDLGVLAVELAKNYTASLRLVAKSLQQVLRRRDAAHLLAGYVLYARDVDALYDSPPVGLAEWLRVRKEAK